MEKPPAAKKAMKVAPPKRHLKVRKADVITKRKGKITADDYLALVKAAVKLQKAAGGQQEMTTAMIKAEAGVDVCDRTCRDAFHNNGVGRTLPTAHAG